MVDEIKKNRHLASEDVHSGGMHLRILRNNIKKMKHTVSFLTSFGTSNLGK